VVALIFLSAQLHGATHAAEFGRDFHEHGGVPCAIQFLCETAKGLSAPTAAAAPTPTVACPVRHGLVGNPPWREALNSDHHIRGPPAFLF
jgi:hypothetical protein